MLTLDRAQLQHPFPHWSRRSPPPLLLFLLSLPPHRCCNFPCCHCCHPCHPNHCEVDAVMWAVVPPLPAKTTSTSLPPLFYVDCCIVAATTTIAELTPPGELLCCHVASFLLCWLLHSTTILAMWYSLPWQMLDDYLAGGCHCPHRHNTARPLPLDNHQTGRHTVPDSIPMTALILPPCCRTDSFVTGWGVPSGPLQQLNGCNCCHCCPHPLPRLSSTLPIGAAAGPRPATPKITPPSLLPCDHSWDNYSPTRDRRRRRPWSPPPWPQWPRLKDDAVTTACP